MLANSLPYGYAPGIGSQLAPLRAGQVNMKAETREDLVVLAKQLNPVVGFYDPLSQHSCSFLKQHTPPPTACYLPSC